MIVACLALIVTQILTQVVAGNVPGDYGDDAIPGLAAAFLSAATALVLTLVTLIWAGVHRIGSAQQRRRGARTSQ